MNEMEKWHKVYETHELKEDIDEIFNMIEGYCFARDIECTMDDRAEDLVSAITKYIEESKK